MAKLVESYKQRREIFLRSVTERLRSNEQILAAWLTGSFARGEQDELSDIDITLVVSDVWRSTLCARSKMVSAVTTKERYELFSLFGRPGLIHENNHNAPEGGTFTCVAYLPDGIMVDWILRPLTGARVPEEARVLFNKAGILPQPRNAPDSLEQRAEQASEIMAFFWMMSAVTLKHIYRGDGVFVNTWLEGLTNQVSEVKRRITGEGWQYTRGSLTSLSVTSRDQIDAVRKLGQQMERLMPAVKQMGGQVHENSMALIESWIEMVQESKTHT